MPDFPVHTSESAPSSSKKLLEQTQANFGFIPNLIGVMATSPELTETYLSVAKLFTQSSLSATEQQIVLLTVSHFHECRYCMAAHTAIAGMQDVSPEIVQAIRHDQPINNSKLQALRLFTYLLIKNRGWVADDDVQALRNAGYETSHILDVLIGVAQKTLSNFTNHLANTPLDEAFKELSWEPLK